MVKEKVSHKIMGRCMGIESGQTIKYQRVNQRQAPDNARDRSPKGRLRGLTFQPKNTHYRQQRQCRQIVHLITAAGRYKQAKGYCATYKKQEEGCREPSQSGRFFPKSASPGQRRSQRQPCKWRIPQDAAVLRPNDASMTRRERRHAKSPQERKMTTPSHWF